MAKMHSRAHGKSGSHKPPKSKEAKWLEYDKEEISSLILKLAKEGNTQSKIGIILRDQYGIPDVRMLGLRVSKVVETEIKTEVPENMYNLMKKAVNMHRHLNEKKKDTKGKHSLELVESKIRRLGKYYVRTGKLPEDWKYTIETAKLLVK
ncbi:MAG: 30S ribosomal protein S15 [Candidatus Aenigmarchaeota archaeon]|nr:30S ribosomal protein S15 [Candidatus Aenigmarchaeota archaeon]